MYSESEGRVAIKQKKQKKRWAVRELRIKTFDDEARILPQHEADALRIEIVGDLSGAGVGSIEHAWRPVNSVLAGRHIVVGVTAVAEADDHARGLWQSWHRSGARIVARSMDSRTLAESIVGPPVPMPPAKSGGRQRFSDSSDAGLLPPRNGHMPRNGSALEKPRIMNEEFKTHLRRS